jgi:hypothetical protein
MIVWRARGILAAIITFVCILTELLTRFFFRNNAYYQQHGWPKLSGFLVAAALVWLLSRRKGDDPRGIRGLTREPLLRERDTLFHIAVRYWPPILCVLGIIFYFVRG